MGGTYRVPPNGLVADGERDLFPASPSDATWLDITIHLGAPDMPDPVYTLTIDLPLRPRPQIANATTADNKGDGHRAPIHVGRSTWRATERGACGLMAVDEERGLR
jgi:hypothetical protein